MSKKANEQKNMIKDLKKEFNNKKQGKEILTVMTGNNCNVIDTSLPKNFFEQIITNEVELSEGFKYEKLATLVQLYLNAIQFYSSESPQKVKAFQNRLEYLLTQKDTLKNLCKIKSEEIKPSKSSNQIRGRAKTKFMLEETRIKKDKIKNKVEEVISEKKSIKQHKNNVKILINKEVENQDKKWKEKLALKRSKRNSMRPLLRISGKKFFNTPGPAVRNSLNIENNNKIEIPKFEKSGKVPKYGNIDDELSEDDNKSDNADIDFLKLFKEKHKEENKKDSDDEGSIIDDNYDDEGLGKIEEVEEENIKYSEKNVMRNFEGNKINEEEIKNSNDNNANNGNIEKKISLKSILKKKDKSKEQENNNNIDSNDLKIEEKKDEEKKEEIKKEEEKKEVEKKDEEKKDEEKNKEKSCHHF